MRRFVSLALACLTLAGCMSTEADGGAPLAIDGGMAAIADFSLLDVNPTSARADTLVSPRDYIGRITAWYFGHAT